MGIHTFPAGKRLTREMRCFVIQFRPGESRFDVMTRQTQGTPTQTNVPSAAAPETSPASVALLRPTRPPSNPVSISAPPDLPQPNNSVELEQSRNSINTILMQMAEERRRAAPAPQAANPAPASAAPAETAYAPHLHQAPAATPDTPPAADAPRGQARNLSGVATVYYQGDADGSGGQTAVGLPMREIEGSSRFQQGLPVVAALSNARRQGINAGDVLLVEVNGKMQGVYVGDIGSGGPNIRGKQRMLDFTPTVFRNTGVNNIYANPDINILEEFSGQRAYVGTDASPRNGPRRERLMQALNQLAQANATLDETQIREAAARVAQVQQELS
jgi:hypothetical protein